MEQVRLGLVGCGKRGLHLAGLFNAHPDCRVTALMDRFPACVERAASVLELADAGRYTEFESMLAGAPVDALLFACDPRVQVELACRAMRAGKDVCTEVPAALALQDCRRLVETVEQTGRKYQLMEQTRYWGFVETWAEMVRAGRLGHVCLAQGEYVHYEREWGYFTDLETGDILRDLAPPPGRKTEPTWRYSILGDPIYYLPHTLGPLLRILDDRVVRVSCMSTRQGSYTYPDRALPWRDIEYALMHTAGDTVLLVGAGFSLPYPRRGQTGHHWYELRGTKGCVESPRGSWDDFRVWRPGMEVHEKMELSTLPVGAGREQARSGHGGADYTAVETFVRALLEDAAPAMDVYEAVRITAPAIVAAESARRGGALLDVPDFRPPGQQGEPAPT